MDESKKLILAFSGSLVETEFLKNKLEDVGVESLIRDEFSEGTHAGFGSSVPGVVDLYIFEEDKEKAKPFLDAMNRTL